LYFSAKVGAFNPCQGSFP